MYVQQVSFTSFTTEYDTDQVNLEYLLGQIQWSDIITDSIVLSEEPVELDTLMRIVEIMTGTADSTNHIESTKLLTDIITASDGIYVLKEELVSDEIKYSETLQGVVNKINRITEYYNISDNVNTIGEFIAIASTILTLLDVVSRGFGATVTDEIVTSDAVSRRLEAYNSLLDQVVFSEALGSPSLTVVLSDELIASESVTTSAIFKSILTDRINFFGSLSFEGETYLAYAINSKTSGVSKYENYGFNSFAYPYAASSDGIYELDTSITDAGTNIDASIRTGIMDFGSSLKKQVPYAYLGITESGRVLLKTISSNKGIKKERWYEVQSYNDAVDTTRVRMGKGVKAKYWQFEISNIEGEEFDLESIEVMPLVLNRRKQ